MKYIILLVLFTFPIICYAQNTFKILIVDIKTGKPMAKKWFTILKNTDQNVDMKRTDSTGIGTFQIQNYDSTASYQVEIVNRWGNAIKSGMYNINNIDKNPQVIKVTPVEASIPFGCGYRSYLSYKPREPYSMSDLPKEIQYKVRLLLVNRAGEKFYNQLMLNGGQIVNLNNLYTVIPDARLWEEIPPIYSLCFSVLDKSKHNFFYSFILNLDQNGKVIGEIELPDIKHNPSQSKIITLEEAKKIALANNFYDNYTSVETIYHSKTGSIVWKFEQLEPGEGIKEQKQLLIDASNGSIVAKLTTKVEVVY